MRDFDVRDVLALDHFALVGGQVTQVPDRHGLVGAEVGAAVDGDEAVDLAL